MDPRIEELIAQGYPPDVAKKMVESGGYDKMTNPYPWLEPLSALNKTGASGITSSGTGSPLSFGAMGEAAPTTAVNSGEVTPEIQALLDQGYNLQEAQQILDQRAAEASGETFGSVRQSQNNGVDPNGLINMFANAGAGISLDQAAYGLGQAIGSDKGMGRTLGIIGNAGKLTLGAARGIASGLGQMKTSQYTQEYYERLKQDGLGRNNYTPAPQSGNSNYAGGQSYGEEGGTQGKTLPIKEFLKSGGFKKPGVKKLM